VKIPGSGAAARTLVAQGPTLGDRFVHWALMTVGERTEIRRGAASRATTAITGATTGFAQDGGAAWYVLAAPGGYEVRVATGLNYEPAPPIVLD